MAFGSTRPALLVPAGLALVLAVMLSFTISLPGPAQEVKTSAAAATALDSLPADTTLVLRVKSLSELEKKFKASPLYALREHPDMKKFIDSIRQKFDEGVSEARNKLGFDPTEIWSLIEGEAVFAIGGLDKLLSALVSSQLMGGEPDVKPGDLPLILIVNSGASAPKLREKLGKLFESQQKDGAKKEVEDFRGGKITTLTRSKAGGGKKEGNEKEGLEKLYFGDLGSYVLVAVSRPFLEATMANLTAPGPESLTKNSDFAATQREVRADSDLSFFLNIRPLAASARKNLQANPMGAMIWGLVEGKILGRSMKNLAVSLSLRDGDIQELGFFNNAGAAEGLLGIFKGPPFPSKPSPLIPEDATQFLSMSLNIPLLYSTVKDIGNTVMGMQGMAGGGPAGAGQGPDFEQFMEASFQIKMKQVVDALGNMLHFYQKGGPSPDNPFGNFTVALELKDEMPIKELLGKLGMMGGLTPQKYLDRDYYPLKGPEGDADSPAVALADKLLVFGIKGDSVKEVMRRAGKGGKGVGDTPGYQSLMALVPPQVTALSYASPKSFRDAMKSMKDSLSFLGEDMPIPDLGAAADVVAGSISYSVWKEQGHFFETLIPWKKGGAAATKPAGEKQEKKS